MADYRDHYAEIRTAGGNVVAISVDKPSQLEELRRELALPFTLLSDAQRRVVQEWDVFNAREHRGIARPAVFVVNRDLTVRFSSVDRVARRLVPADILPIVRGATPEIAPRRHTYVPRFADFGNAFANQIRSFRT